MKTVCRFALLLTLCAQPAFAAEVFLHVFFEEAPLQNVNVSMGGDIVGRTDNRGAFSLDLEAGEHTLDLSFQGRKIAAVDFEVTDPDNEEIEIEVDYSRDGGDPGVRVQSFPMSGSGGDIWYTLDGSDPHPDERRRQRYHRR